MFEIRSRADLRGYQNRAVKFMDKRRYGGLLIDMGLGKTIIALTAFVNWLLRGEVESILVVAPLRVVQAVWRQEAKLWRHTRKLQFSLVHGSPAERLHALRKPAHIYLINPENLKWLATVLGKKPWPWDVLFVDESTEFSVPNTVRFKSLRKGLRHFKRRYIATGTPVPRSLLQLWSQMYIADGGASLGQRYTDYKENHFYRTGFKGYKLEPKEGSEEVITEAVSRRIIRLAAEDYLQLPEINTVPIWIELPSHARELYDRLEQEMFASFEGHSLDDGDEEVSVLNAAALSSKCRQICNGFIYTKNSETGQQQWRPIHDAKLDALKELRAETGEPNMLVPYVFKPDVLRLKAMFPHFRFFHKDRVDKLVDSWNAGRIPGLILSPASSKYGLNMQKGGYSLCWFGCTFSRLQWDQTIGRLRRSGQVGKQIDNYVLLVRDTADEIAYQSVIDHGERQDRIDHAFRSYYRRRYGGAL